MKKKLSITIDEVLIQVIRASAERENRSLSQEIEKILRDYYIRVSKEGEE